MKRLIICLTLILLTQSVSVQAQTTAASISSVKKTYQRELDAVPEASLKRQTEWGEQYKALLKEHSDLRDSWGDDRGVDAVQKEVKRFDETGSLVEEDFSRDTQLKMVQRKHFAEIGDIEKQEYLDTISISEKYVKFLLLKRKNALTAGMKVDAEFYDKEIKSVLESDVYVGSRDIIKEMWPDDLPPEISTAPPKKAAPAKKPATTRRGSTSSRYRRPTSTIRR